MVDSKERGICIIARIFGTPVLLVIAGWDEEILLKIIADQKGEDKSLAFFANKNPIPCDV